MIKYIVFAFLAVLLLLNYTVATVSRVLFKKELSEKQIIKVKLLLYVVMLMGVIYIMCKF